MTILRFGQILFIKQLQIGRKPQYFASDMKYYCCEYNTTCLQMKVTSEICF